MIIYCKENAKLLYRINNVQIKALAEVNINDEEDYEVNYSEIYRSRLVAVRLLKRDIRKKRRLREEAEEPVKKAAEGGG